MTPTDTTILVVCVVAAAIGLSLDFIFPQRASSGKWDSSKPATQRDLADVINFRAPRQAGPRVLPLVVLLVIILGIAMAFGGKYGG